MMHLAKTLFVQLSVIFKMLQLGVQVQNVVPKLFFFTWGELITWINQLLRFLILHANWFIPHFPFIVGNVVRLTIMSEASQRGDHIRNWVAEGIQSAVMMDGIKFLDFLSEFMRLGDEEGINNTQIIFKQLEELCSRICTNARIDEEKDKLIVVADCCCCWLLLLTHT